MNKKKKHFSVRAKMYIFVIITVLAVAAGTSFIAFRASASQIDKYYRQNAADNARNFASMLSANYGDYLRELRSLAEKDEFQELRDKAEEEDDESLIEDYLKKNDMWDKYYEIRDKLSDYLKNMDGIKYLYVAAPGDKNAEYDMYLVDDDENPIYETGYYEEREEDLLGLDITNLDEPTISDGDWGWLCSAFKPVYDSDGKCVCVVGCDIGMDDVMQERRRMLIILLAGAVIFTSVVLVGAMMFINKIVVKPLARMTREMKNFTPSESYDYEASGVMNLDIKSNDEIGEIYQGIRSMQITTIDSMHDMSALQKDMQKAENDVKAKEAEIGKLNVESHKDALTGVGNKAAYLQRTEELNIQLKREKIDFAVVMVDMNNLKKINDNYGHKSGDIYIKGCCRMICDAFKHSPVFRIGGDEFVAILQGPDYNRRAEICEKLRKDFEDSFNQVGVDPWRKYSAAVGIAEKASDESTVEPVFKRADKSMYEDKEEFKKKYGSAR